MDAFNQSQQTETSDTIILAKDLTPDAVYELKKLERINTRFGKTLLAYIKVGMEDRKLFLPKYLNEKLTDDHIDVINNRNLNIKFVGSIRNSYNFELVERE